jgi:hypothetical protein
MDFSMKRMYLFFILSIFFIFNFSFICIATDSVTIVKKIEVERISKIIDEFNQMNLSKMRHIILTRFSQLSSKELDNLIIVIEPRLIINQACKRSIEDFIKDSIFPHKSYNMRTFCLYQLIPDSILKTTYACFLNSQIIWNDTLKFAVRLYNQNNIQEYYLEIAEPGDSKELKPIGGNKFHNWASFEEISYNSRTKLNSIPININCFSIDINPTFLQRCIIFENKIYSFDCLREKFKDIPLEVILKEHLNEINDCDIDIEFTKKE